MPYDIGEFTNSFWTVFDGDFYVSTYGNDLSGDGTPKNPFLTIGRAMEEAINGEKIVIGPNQYLEVDEDTPAEQSGAEISCRLATFDPVALDITAHREIDSVMTTAGDRVLLCNQDDPAENGIYIAQGALWSRASDFNSTENMTSGALIPILEGAKYAKSIFQHTTPTGIVVGTTTISFERMVVWGEIDGDITQQADLQEALGGLQSALEDKADKTNVLELDNAVVYEPSQDYHPATRKYVLDQFEDLPAVFDKATPKGFLNCSSNPNYPIGVIGDYYYVPVGEGGKIGGASGTAVQVGDKIQCVTDNAGGTQAAVGSSWIVFQGNLDKSSTTEAQAGTDDEKYLTPQTGSIGWEGWIVNRSILALNTSNDTIVGAINELQSSSSAALTDGSGTTANGSAADLGGTMSSDVTIDPNGNAFSVNDGNNDITLDSSETKIYRRGIPSPSNYAQMQFSSYVDDFSPQFEFVSMKLEANAPEGFGTGNFIKVDLNSRVGFFVSSSSPGETIGNLFSLPFSTGSTAGFRLNADNQKFAFQDQRSAGKNGVLLLGFGEASESDATGADYSSLAETSLVPKAYVDQALQNAGVELTDGSGTTANGTAIDLGGVLSSNAIIDPNGNQFSINDGNNYITQSSSETIIRRSRASATSHYAQIRFIDSEAGAGAGPDIVGLRLDSGYSVSGQSQGVTLNVSAEGGFSVSSGKQGGGFVRTYFSLPISPSQRAGVTMQIDDQNFAFYESRATGDNGVLLLGFGEASDEDATGADYTSLVGTSLVPKAYVDAKFNDNSSGGTGDVNKVGTPVNNQIGIWTGDGTIEGNSLLTFDGTKLFARSIEIGNTYPMEFGTEGLIFSNTVAKEFIARIVNSTGHFKVMEGSVTELWRIEAATGLHTYSKGTIVLPQSPSTTAEGALRYSGGSVEVYDGIGWSSAGGGSSGSGDVSKVGTPSVNEFAVWTGDGTLQGVSAIRLSDSGLTKMQIISGNNAMNINANGLESFTAGSGTSNDFVLIGNAENDSGSSPITSLISKVDSSSVSIRPVFAGYNHTTKLWEVAADGTWDFQGNFLTNLADPVNPQDAATKSYVDTNGGFGDLGFTSNFLAKFVTMLSDSVSQSTSMVVSEPDYSIQASFGININDSSGAAIFNGQNTANDNHAMVLNGVSNSTNDVGSIPLIKIKAGLTGSDSVLNRPLCGFYNQNALLAFVGASGNWDFQGNRLTNLAEPIDPQDAATKAYVDANSGGGVVDGIGKDKFIRTGGSGSFLTSWSDLNSMESASAFFLYINSGRNTELLTCQTDYCAISLGDSGFSPAYNDNSGTPEPIGYYNVRTNGQNNAAKEYYLFFTDQDNVLGSHTFSLSLRGVVSGAFSGQDWSPSEDNIYDVGTSILRWQDIYATNSVIQTSDKRKKKLIKKSNLGLGFIESLNPVSYKWKDGGNRPHYGFIAQEVMETLGDIDFAGFINDKEADTFGLRYSEFIAPMVKAIQELSQKVEKLEAKLKK